MLGHLVSNTTAHLEPLPKHWLPGTWLKRLIGLLSRRK
jgi:hypothetical protein